MKTLYFALFVALGWGIAGVQTSGISGRVAVLENEVISLMDKMENLSSSAQEWAELISAERDDDELAEKIEYLSRRAAETEKVLAMRRELRGVKEVHFKK
jgi:tRNA(Ser,Leu) C12 N-acetylase TAN1